MNILVVSYEDSIRLDFGSGLPTYIDYSRMTKEPREVIIDIIEATISAFDSIYRDKSELIEEEIEDRIRELREKDEEIEELKLNIENLEREKYEKIEEAKLKIKNLERQLKKAQEIKK